MVRKALLAADAVDLHWVDSDPPTTTPAGTAFGIPWTQGQIDRTTALQLVNTDGSGIPVQTWPLAYWPDGSLKWTGHALASNSGLSKSLRLSFGTPPEPKDPVTVAETKDEITVKTGVFEAVFAKSGTTLIKKLSLSGAVKVQDGILVMLHQSTPDSENYDGSKPKIHTLNAKVESVVVEQRGPVRAVIKVTGKYSGSGRKDGFQWTTRFYVAAGGKALRVVHFFIFDGDHNSDFIKGLGVQFKAPLSPDDKAYDRHIRFASATGGVFGEAVTTLSGLRRDATAAVLTPQFNGQPCPDLATWPSTITAGLKDLAVWNDFTLDQLEPEVFQIKKRTISADKSSWLRVIGGRGDHAAGSGYVGGARGGGVGFGMREFWQCAPRSLDIRGANEDVATVSLWAYSPRAPAMDMRHYSDVPHGLDLAYEDVGNPDPDPAGIGRSYEFTLELYAATPSRDEISRWGVSNANIPQIVATPEFYMSHKLFGGAWAAPSDSSSAAQTMNKRHSALLDFYIAEVKQRSFYGFWDYGDVMHTYDQTRHTWRYDVGGYAWDNGELGTDLWLWFSFLRTGRADVFHLVRALTKHLSETDTHHTGTFAGLGSRHNVSHWGDGAKEARVASAWLRRPYYYLTTDELMGDVMETMLQVDESIVTWEPFRKVLGPWNHPEIAPGRVRIGPDWVTMAGGWFAQWERTNDTKWRDRIKTGMNDIGKMPNGLFSGYGSAVSWDPKTAHLTDSVGQTFESSYHLMMIFGGGDFLMEAMEVITDEPEFDAAWLDFCRLFNGTADEKIARYGRNFNSGGFANLYNKFQVYAGVRLKQNDLKTRAWANVNIKGTFGNAIPVDVGGADVITPVREIPNLNTNDSASATLAEYAVLAMAPDFAPAQFNALTEGTEDWEASTVYSEKSDGYDGEKKRKNIPNRSMLRRIFCL